MTVLRIVVDELVDPKATEISGYVLEITRALIATAPRDCTVEGIISASARSELDAITGVLPGLADVTVVAMPRRELAVAWKLGVLSVPGGGMLHSPSLFAPLRRHDRVNSGEQVTVTMHDAFAWTDPSSLLPSALSWRKSVANRARKHADAVIVPTHALAEALRGYIDLGDRVRVIGTAPRAGLIPLADPSEVIDRLGLPDEYLVATASWTQNDGIADLTAALELPGAPDLALLIVDSDAAPDAEDGGPGALRNLGRLAPADLAVVLSRATAFVAPAHNAGSGTAIIEAFSLGTPVIHSSAPAFVEVAADAGLRVEDAEPDSYREGLADAIARVAGDASVAQRLRLAGRDRARAFSWRDAGDRLWQLHADL